MKTLIVVTFYHKQLSKPHLNMVWLMAYGFVGAGFPEHYDLTWSIVHPL
jgi:hypothetical protein